jgi:hypothetical protein
MPYIEIKTVQHLSAAEKVKIKAELGKLIEIIPTKKEEHLLIDFSDGRTTYRAGADVNGAFVELRILGKAPFEAKKKFTEACFSLLAEELGIEKGHMYLNILEFENWGSGGSYH